MIHYPSMSALFYAVEKPRTSYPGDHIRLVSIDVVLERAIEFAKTQHAIPRALVPIRSWLRLQRYSMRLWRGIS